MVPRQFFPCIAQEAGFLGLVWWLSSTATWRLSCTQYTVLCRFMYAFKWRYASPLDVASSARIHCDLKCSKDTSRRSVSFSCQPCTKFIVYGWNMWRWFIRCTHAVFLTDICAHLLLSWRNTTALLASSVYVLEKIW